MRLGLQMGHGMQSLAVEFLEHQGSKNDVILSPRNFTGVGRPPEERMVDYALGKVSSRAGEILVDPQLFCSGSMAGALPEFSYWQQCGGKLESAIPETLEAIVALNERCSTKSLITPSAMCDSINERWVEQQAMISERMRALAFGRPVYLTVALGQDALKRDGAVDELIYGIESWDVDGIYIVAEHPNNEYLVDRPLWLYNLMCVGASAKRAGKKVFVGYAAHQMLSMALTGCDALFTGNYLNVRRFERATFAGRDNQIKQRVKWYYAPQTLSEFKLTTLDLARQQGVLDLLRSPYGDDDYTGMLFSGGYPSDTAYGERHSFMHYLISLNQQSMSLNQSTYDACLASLQQLFSTAESLLEALREVGIYDRARSFADGLPSAFQAISAFESTWGFQMRQEWANLR